MHQFLASNIAVQEPGATLLPDALYVTCFFLSRNFESLLNPQCSEISEGCALGEDFVSPLKSEHSCSSVTGNFLEVFHCYFLPHISLFSLSRALIIQVLGFLYWPSNLLIFPPLLFHLFSPFDLPETLSLCLLTLLSGFSFPLS